MPQPPPNWDLSGWAETGELRLRSTWLGFVVIERRMIHQDGSSKWRRRPSWYGPVDVSELGKPSVSGQ